MLHMKPDSEGGQNRASLSGRSWLRSIWYTTPNFVAAANATNFNFNKSIAQKTTIS